MGDPAFWTLRFLSVRHLAVIEAVEVEFAPGLNVLSGETGAGKSMLVEALDLLSGARARTDLVRTGEEQASVQAVFDAPDGGELIVRRDVTAQGRSRAFVDGELTTTGALRELGARVLELHGQHEHQSLLDPAEHLLLLDEFADAGARRDLVGERYQAWRGRAAALEQTRLDAREKAARVELASYQLSEIDRVNPEVGEDERLATERLVLANAERLTRLSAEAYARLYDGDAAVLAQLAAVWKRLADLAPLDPRFAPFLAQRDEVTSRLEDLAFFLRSYGVDLDASPERLQAVEDRLAAIERLKKKYGPAIEDIVGRRDRLRAELDALDASDERAAALERAATEAAQAYLSEARALSALRGEAGRRLGAALVAALADLAMPDCRVEVRASSTDDPTRWSPSGIDLVEFFLSANPGEDVRPLARIASGGELSRVMLALRTLSMGAPSMTRSRWTGGAAHGAPARVLVFDEVDAGIGGAAADAVGARLQQLGGRAQVLCVTHLPQIAARADAHFAIVKDVRAGRTLTLVDRVAGAAREREIARMMAGTGVSAQLIASAREVLASRSRGESEAMAKGESESTPMAKTKGRRRDA